MNIIDTIRVSGTDYTLSATSSGGASAVEVTQAEYDALVSGGTVDPNTFYIITDAQAGDLTQYWTSAQTNSAINAAVSGKQDTLSAGTGIDITDNVISATGGGGKAISGGTNISVTTGETADTINCTLPCYKDSGDIWTIFGNSSSSSSNKSTGAIKSVYIGFQNEIKNTNISVTRTTSDNILIGFRNKLDSYCTNSYGVGFNAIIGKENTLSGKNDISESYVIGSHNVGNTSHVFICGWSNEARNSYETSFGQYNNSVSASTTFGDSGNTLFSVGNGTADNARHNAFEIRQNGDIYLSLNGQDVKLQDQLGGGGGSSYTAGDGIDITNDVISVTGKVDTSAITTSISSSSTDSEIPSAKAVYESISGKVDTSSMSGYVTTNTEQTISGRKIFKYSANGAKTIELKQTSDSAKVGFRIINSAETNNEVASFEFRPNTFTIDNVQHPLMYFGHYRNTNTANAGVPQTVIGFRQYDQLNAAAYHYLMPLPEKAKTPFNLTTSFKDYFAPLGFKVDSGGTMVTTDNTGVVDLSSEFSGKVDTSAITTSVTSSSTDAQVPSAKAVYDTLGNINTILESI